MSKGRIWLAAAILGGALLALVSCGGDGDDGVAPPDDTDLVAMLEPLFDSEVTGAARNLRLPNGPPGCITVTPASPVDSDADCVPDDATFTFDEVGCAYPFPSGGGGTTGGEIRVTDPGEPFGYNAVLTNFLLRVTSGDPQTTTTRTINGTQAVSGSPAAATMVRNVTIVTERTGLSAATAVEELTVTYTPDVPPLGFCGLGLPAGTMTMTGDLTWTMSGRTVEMAITTATPLAVGGCDLGGPSSGEIHVTVVSGADPGYLSIRFESCEPVIDWYPD